MWSKVNAMVKEQMFFLKKCEEHGIFHTGSLTKPSLLYSELYLPQNDSILSPLTPDEVLTKSFLRKPYLRNMSPELFCYDDFSADFFEFPIRRGCYAKSVSSESRLKKMILEILSPELFYFHFSHQNKGFDNLRTRI